MHLQRSSQDPDTANCKKKMFGKVSRKVSRRKNLCQERNRKSWLQTRATSAQTISFQTMFDFIFLPPSFNWIVIFLRLMDVPVSLSSETPDISWYKDNVQIVATGDLFQYMNYNRTLRLGSLRSISHNGIYKCVAGISGAILQKTTTLKVIGLYFFRRIF